MYPVLTNLRRKVCLTLFRISLHRIESMVVRERNPQKTPPLEEYISISVPSVIKMSNQKINGPNKPILFSSQNFSIGYITNKSKDFVEFILHLVQSGDAKSLFPLWKK